MYFSIEFTEMIGITYTLTHTQISHIHILAYTYIYTQTHKHRFLSFSLYFQLRKISIERSKEALR